MNGIDEQFAVDPQPNAVEAADPEGERRETANEAG
jgi:hypothetical protein